MPQQSKRRSGRGVDISPMLLARLDLPTRSFNLKWIVNDDTPDEPSLIIAPTPTLSGIDLTALTVEELLLFKRFIDIAIDTAMPICRALDDAATDDFENGLGVNRRLYRPASQLLNFGTPKPTPNPTNEMDEHAHQGEHSELSR